MLGHSETLTSEHIHTAKNALVLEALLDAPEIFRQDPATFTEQTFANYPDCVAYFEQLELNVDDTINSLFAKGTPVSEDRILNERRTVFQRMNPYRVNIHHKLSIVAKEILKLRSHKLEELLGKDKLESLLSEYKSINEYLAERKNNDIPVEKELAQRSFKYAREIFQFYDTGEIDTEKLISPAKKE